MCNHWGYFLIQTKSILSGYTSVDTRLIVLCEKARFLFLDTCVCVCVCVCVWGFVYPASKCLTIVNTLS